MRQFYRVNAGNAEMVYPRLMDQRGAFAYLTVSVAASLYSVLLVLRDPKHFSLTCPAYWRQLMVPWKLASFALATGFFVLAAPFTGDPTWDWFDASLMSLLTFATAPWSVGTLFLALRRRASKRRIFVASTSWLFSASTSYDLYIMLRDGIYPPSWFWNLIVSSVLYFAAGLMWTLTQSPGRGVIFGFMVTGWPEHPEERVRGRTLTLALVFVVLVVATMTPFLAELWNGISARP